MLSQRLLKLTPYVPGEQPQDRQYLKLNTNECPYPPTPRIQSSIEPAEMARLRLYPDPRMNELRTAIGRYHGLPPEQVFTGNGSDEVLSFCFYAFFGAEMGPLAFPAHTYSFYPVYCDFYQIPYRRVPLTEDFQVDLGGFYGDGTNLGGAIFANPNAPTGQLLAPERVAAFLARFPSDRVVIVDEAYVDFGGRSVVPLLAQHPNLIVTRTFSKSLALAGIRLGYALGHPDLIQALFTVKDSFNSYPLDRLAQRIGVIAITDTAYYRQITGQVVRTRERFGRSLAAMGWRVLPSSANFVFTSRPGLDGATIYQSLKAEGILVRHFAHPGIESFVRITIGTDPQMDRLLETAARLWP